MLVTVYGKPSSGKSTIITNLACVLAENGSTVGLMSADMSYSSLQLYFNSLSQTPDTTIGALFEKRDFNNISKYFLPVRGLKNIYIAGPHPEDPAIKYPLPDQEDVMTFLARVRDAFNFSIIESIVDKNNSLSILSIKEADCLINVMQPSIQGISYTASHEYLIKAIKPKTKIIRAAGNVYETMDAKSVEESFGFDFDFIFEHSKEVMNASESCKPAYYSFGGKRYKSFIREINNLSDWLIKEEATYGEL